MQAESPAPAAGMRAFSDSFPGGLSRLGYALAPLLMVLYLGRLIILDARDPVVVAAALLTGLAASPAWFVWTGMSLRRTM